MPELVITAAASGSTTLTISAAESANYAKPASKSVSVNTKIWPASISDMTPAIIKEIVDAKKTSEFLHPGDLTPLIPFVGNVDNQVFNMKIRCRIVHIDDDGHPIFQIAQNEAGQEIALVHQATIGRHCASGTYGFCMNREGRVGTATDTTLDPAAMTNGPNKGGWEKCYARVVLMKQLKACFPEEWQSAMRLSTVWSPDSDGYSNTLTDDLYSSTLDALYLPSVYNISGRVVNTSAAVHEQYWDWYKAGNSIVAHRHDAPTLVTPYRLRNRNHRYTYVFYTVDSSNKNPQWCPDAAYSYGMRPCFSI